MTECRYRYIRASEIRALVKKKGKRCGRDFLSELDDFVYDAICRACTVFNGSKKTLNYIVAQLVLGKLKI